MRSDAALRALEDICRNIELTRVFLTGMEFGAFSKDEKSLYAVVRCLEIISEASRRLPDDLKARHADVPWSQIAGAGNVFRPDYEDILPRIVWNTVTSQVFALENAARLEPDRLKPPSIP